MQRSGRKRGRALLVVMAIGLAPLAMYTAAARTASLSVRTERADDVARVVREARGTTIEVTSPFGIGRMIVSPSAHGAWPSSLRLRLRYAAGRPLRSLEGLDMSVDGTVVATREAMRVEAGRGWLEVTLPAGVTTAGRPLHVQWVDAYRR
jgi:hypothetical protein